MFSLFVQRKPEEEEDVQPDINAAIWYNLGQTGIYAIMAVGIMRLKLFLTPHMCIIVALLAKDKVHKNQPKYLQYFIIIFSDSSWSPNT